MFDELPPDVRANAREAYQRWLENQSHPGLRFKQIDDERNLWSVRIDQNYRAVCRKRHEGTETVYVWIWVGPHDEYERLIRS